jgi:predicted O-methyltransferase YrrM
MRSVGHWTPRYVVDRLRELRYSRAHPEHPWLTPQANQILDSMLLPTDEALEYGSGRSTSWLAGHVRRLTSVEHDERWHATVSAQLKDRGLDNVDYLFAPRDVPAERGGESEYARVSSRFADGSLDIALVDGIYRDYCAQAVLPKLRPGGMLVIDNVNWFLPSQSRSPNSRAPGQGPDGPVWADVLDAMRDWRRIWTCSGVWDTALFFKP